jgi:hypothetical protein
VLHLSEDEIGCDNWAIDPGPIKQLEQLLHLFHLGTSRSRRPALLLLRNLADVTCHKWFLLPLHVEPFAVSIPHRGVQGDIQIMRFHVISEKQIRSSGYFGPPDPPFFLR